MRATKIMLSALAIAATSYGVALAAEAMPASVKVEHGMLTGEKGMTLYTFDRDTTPNKSSCNGMCLKNWPELKADANAKDMGDWTVITRDDGSKQWAYKGKPLYYFAMDMAAGDAKGDGRAMVWHVAKP